MADFLNFSPRERRLFFRRNKRGACTGLSDTGPTLSQTLVSLAAKEKRRAEKCRGRLECFVKGHGPSRQPRDLGIRQDAVEDLDLVESTIKVS